MIFHLICDTLTFIGLIKILPAIWSKPLINIITVPWKYLFFLFSGQVLGFIRVFLFSFAGQYNLLYYLTTIFSFAMSCWFLAKKAAYQD